MRGVSNEVFFKDVNAVLKLFTVFIRGDLFLLPLLLVLAVISLLFTRFGLLLTGFFITCRYLGEMIFWIMSQFMEKKYRPHDFGFTKLDAKAVYILYQLFAICMMTVGAGIMFYAAFFMK